MLFESFQHKFKESIGLLMQTAAATAASNGSEVSFQPMYAVLASQERQHYENDIKVLIDTIIRETMIKQACEPEINLAQVETLLRLSIEFARVEECSVNLPVVLLGELFDCRTLAECELLFSAVDRHLATWKEELFFKNVKNHLLRICNDLLRRLSRIQNTVFCGRILIFLANFFPLFERSGLNLTSEFNQDNSTSYALQAEEEEGGGSDGATPGADGNSESNSSTTNAANTDLNFYRKFWQLQEYFRNPTVCYTRGRFKAFQGHCTDVLAVFADNKIDADSGFYFQTLQQEDSKSNGNGQASNGKANADAEDGQQQQSFFFVKYLTNQKLLELQLNDSNFRRHILIQMLILFQYFTATVKFRSETLSEEQAAWVGETRRRVLACIEETPPNGAEVCKVVEQLLQREEYWNHWKNEGCKEELKVATAKEATSEAEAEAEERQAYIRSTYAGPHKRARLGDYLRSKAGTGKVFMGNADMGRLWNIEPDNMAACRSASRDFTPNIARYFEEWNDLSTEERSIWCEDSNHCWRTLRLLSARCNHFFVPSNVVVKYVKDYLHGVTDRLAADLHQQQQVQTTEAIEQQPDRKQENDQTKQSASHDTEDISDDELLKNEPEEGEAGESKLQEEDKTAGEVVEEEEEEEDMDDLESGNDLMTTESGTTAESSGTTPTTAEAAVAADQITPAIIEQVAEKLAEHWDAVSPFFGYQDDEIEYIKESFPELKGRMRHLVSIWKDEQDPEQATLKCLQAIVHKAKLDINL